MPDAKGYYAGGFRAVIGGIPIRLARKPSAHDLAWSRRNEAEREKPLAWGRSHGEREAQAKQRAKEANDAIALYAEMLEISEVQARARIAAQRQHVLANPPRDTSLEYDL